ncbi:Guanine nucleotide-binding protein alpha subunit [Mycena venus]|uniref:Guanine nucleotide-binding protein alpha subunit n=1 Tax=Mycena venus TaxID=2733690 RepID=A0A8H6Z1T6_9AGAR|nr:Guanine nucleotide-binding protein alpha subunit [Mycena venus]
MGNAQSSETLNAKENTRQIEKQLKQDRKTSRTTIHILLFGGEESTRSAWLEQVKVLHPTSNTGPPGQSSSESEDLDGAHTPAETMGPGVIETIFKGDELTYKLIDVGRQRSETMKWMPCFADVHAILFLVDWSAYDQVNVTDDEDGDPVNRLKESLALFDTVCNSQWFQNTSIILVLTDTAAFTRKLRHVPLSDYFPDYTGGAGILSRSPLPPQEVHGVEPRTERGPRDLRCFVHRYWNGGYGQRLDESRHLCHPLYPNEIRGGELLLTRHPGAFGI